MTLNDVARFWEDAQAASPGREPGGAPGLTTRARRWLVLAFLLVSPIVAAAQAQEAKPPECVAVRVGFAGRYKAGLWTPIEVTLRGGNARDPVIGRVRASLTDSDGLNCSFDAPERCELIPGKETSVGQPGTVLYVCFGHESSPLTLDLHDGHTTLAAKTFNSNQSPPEDQFPDALGSEQRLIVLVAKNPSGLEKAVPGTQGQSPQNVVATVDSLARLPTRWQGYEGVDIVLISTSSPDVFAKISPDNTRIEALEQWVRMGGTLVLCAGSHAEEALHAGSPLAKFVPGRFDKTVPLGQTSGWETYVEAKERRVQPIPPPKPGEKVELPTPRLSGVQGKIEAHEADLPLVIRKPQGLGQVVFVAADLDRGPIRDWSDRPRLVAAILGLSNKQAGTAGGPVQSYGYDDLAGQLRSAMELFRDVHLVPFYVVALLVIVYILLIGPGDYFLLRRLGRGTQWTWVTFPAIVVLFATGAYLANNWLKGDQLRVNQVDLVDIDAEGTARGASWFSIFSPGGKSFDHLSMRPRLPDGQTPQAWPNGEQPSVALAWLGKAGKEFNGMYSRDAQTTAPLWSRGYAIAWSPDATSLDAIRDVPIQVGASKSFVQRWLGHTPHLGLDVSLHDDGRQLSGTITNRLTPSAPQAGSGVTLSQCFLAYEGWAYKIDTLRPGEPVEIGPQTRRYSLDTFLSGESMDLAGGSAAGREKGPYDTSSRDMAYVLKAMMFYDAAGGRKRSGMAGMANDYQGFTDLSGLLKTGRAILVAMPPQDGSCRGGDLLRGPAPKTKAEPDTRQPLGSALDRHTTIYRFILPVTAAQAGSEN